MVPSHLQNELKEGSLRSVSRQYYYIDYLHFCNVVKWRMAEMRQRIVSMTASQSVSEFLAKLLEALHPKLYRNLTTRDTYVPNAANTSPLLRQTTSSIRLWGPSTAMSVMLN